MRLLLLGRSAYIFIIFVLLYVFAGLWSDEPIDAVKYKGLYGLCVLTGLMLARSIRDFDDLEKGLRVLIIGIAIFVGLMFVEFAESPLAIWRRERLGFWGMNPNRIGQTLAPMLIIVAYMCLYDSMKIWRMAGYAIGVCVGILIIFTGSRGAAGEGVLGCFVVSIPMFKRPGMLILIGTIVVVAVLFTFATAETEAPDRLIHGSLDTREAVWSFAMDRVSEAPVFGHGWIYNTTSGGLSSRNMHSIYFQTAVETGIVGLIVLGVVLIVVLSRGARMFIYVRASGIESQTAYLAVALVLAVLAHGLIEAGSVRGSTINGFILPFGIGLFDRLPELVRSVQDYWRDNPDELEEPELLDSSEPNLA